MVLWVLRSHSPPERLTVCIKYTQIKLRVLDLRSIIMALPYNRWFGIIRHGINDPDRRKPDWVTEAEMKSNEVPFEIQG